MNYVRSAAIARHISKNHVNIIASPGYHMVLFTLKDGNVEAVVAADDGSETIRLLVAGPSPTQHMAIKNTPEGVDIMYAEKPDAV